MKSFHRLLLGIALLGAATAHAQKNIANEELDPASGTRLQVRSVFDPVPPSGYAPVRVVATNGTGRNARWGFDFHSQTQYYRQQNEHRSSFALDVPARSTQSALFMVPLAVDYGDRTSGGTSGHVLRVDFSGTGFDVGSKYEHENRVTHRAALALSETLAEFSITQLNKEMESRLRSSSGGYYGGPVAFGSRFDVSDLPDSWLGYSGFDFILLSSTDCQKLKPGVKRALLEWVRLGGTLHVYLSPGSLAASLGLPGVTDAGSKVVSLGRIAFFGWDGKTLPAGETISRYWGERPRLESLRTDHAASGSWPLLSLLGTRSFASWQVIVFLVVFGMLVGPVNLFVLAPAGRRHKLFVTTPLLSIGASLVMVVLILFQDGTGGTGRRFLAINLEPEEAAAYVTQEQVSRTGVLLGAAFEMKQPVLIEPLSMPDTPWAKLKNSVNVQPADLTQDGRERRGNFFQSRAEQGQALRAAVSTRARMELKAGAAPDAPPTLISALGFTVEELFYTDAAGAHWRLEKPLGTGQSATLLKADDSAQRLWREAAFDPAVSSLKTSLIRATTDRRPFFVAKARQAPDFTLDTLSSIRWENDRIVVFGPVTQP
ncbi:hypothetical protein [Prosthecobacter sp.]|uniref:hypothetical protein n=1 Tax=Prosthecobacter sp. TaxID=1965333 RepID=UPI00378443E4